MNLIKNKFFICVLLFSVTIYLMWAPTARAGFFSDLFGSFFLTFLAVVIVVVAVVTQQYWVPMVMVETFGGAVVGGGLAGTLVISTAAFGTTAILSIGGVLTALVACAEGLICPEGQSSGLYLMPISGSGNTCAYQIPMTFYNPKMNVSYGYPAFVYSYWSGVSSGSIGTMVNGVVDNKALFKDSSCVNSVTDPYSNDNKYAKLANGVCAGIFPSNVFKYISGNNILSPILKGIGFSPHYRDSACANLISDPFSIEAKYAKVSGVGCVSIAPSGSLAVVDPYFNETDRQVAIYRYTLPADSDLATLNNWFLYTIKANVGNGWQSTSYISYSGGYLGNPQNGDYGYLTSSEATPLIIAPYAKLCAGNVCKFTDATAPENSYIAYVAKILGTYTYIFTAGFLGPTNSAVVTKDNKFFNTDNASYSWFPLVETGFIQGNAIAGPYKTGTINPADCPANAFSLTVTKSGVGSGIVYSNDYNINCGSDCSESYTSGTSVTLTASAMEGSTFTGWLSEGCSGTGSCVVSVTQSINIGAVFNTSQYNLSQYNLNVSKSGTGSGTVTSNPAGINCGSDCSENYRPLQ